MILWDRIKKSLDSGLEKVTNVSKVVSERARIEASVARLLIDKGTLEAKEGRCRKKLGERVFMLWEQHSDDILGDPVVMESIVEISEIREELGTLKLNIQKAALGDEEA